MSQRKIAPIIDALKEFEAAKARHLRHARRGQRSRPRYHRPVARARTCRSSVRRSGRCARWRGLPHYAQPQAPPRRCPRLPAAKRLPPGVIPEYLAKRFWRMPALPFHRVRSSIDLWGRSRGGTRYRLSGRAEGAEPRRSRTRATPAASCCGSPTTRRWPQAGPSSTPTSPRRGPACKLDGVLVEAMARPGVELILGARNDHGLGPSPGRRTWRRFSPRRCTTCACCRRTSRRPQSSTELGKLKGAALLARFRGAPARDLAAVAAMASRLGAFILAHPEIAEIDINPVMVYGQGRRRRGARRADRDALMIDPHTRHSGARATPANPESRDKFGKHLLCVWLPGPVLRTVPE